MTAVSENGRQRRQLVQPRVAEMVAAQLRIRIVNGELRDGDLLPKQDELIAEFPVGRPSIREAMRILETEGLISVRRGNMGGAVVHAPSAESAAYNLGLVMQNLGVTVADLAQSVRLIEPQCAALCATRADRETEVLPMLRELNAELAGLEDGPEFTRSARKFHDEIVKLCGNTTLRLVMLALEALWSSYEVEWADSLDRQGRYYDTTVLETCRRTHNRITAAIEEGDGRSAAHLVGRHIEGIQLGALDSAGHRRVSVIEAPFQSSTRP